MSPFAEFPLLTIFMLLVLVVVFTSVFSSRKGGRGSGPAGPPQPGAGSTQRICPACGTDHPVHATFCRQCGRGL